VHSGILNSYRLLQLRHNGNARLPENLGVLRFVKEPYHDPRGKAAATQTSPPTSAEEENLLLEVLDDSRLRSIGIDPDGDSVDIMVELMRRLEVIEAQNALAAESNNTDPQKA
jgi:hypothetical protein